MAFINDDNDIWGDASSKTSEGKFNSGGGGYGRHGSARGGGYGRHATSSRGQGNDLLADAQDFLLEEDLPRGGDRHSSAMEDMRQRELERARQRASKRLGGPGVNRSGKPSLQGSSSPVRQKARDFSRPRQNLRFGSMNNSSNVSFGMDDGNQVSHFDPFDDDDLEEEELPSKSSLRRGNRREVVSESIDRNARHGYVDEDYDDQERWKAGSEKVNEKARKRAARERNLFDDDEVEELDQDEDGRRGGRRSVRSDNNKGRGEGKTSDDGRKKKKKPVRMVDSDDDDHVATTIQRKSPSKKNRSSRFKDSKRKGFVEEDEDTTTGVVEGKTQNKKNRKKGRVPRPPREVDSDDGDEDDMFKIDPHALDRRNLTKEVSKQPSYANVHTLTYLLTRLYLLHFLFSHEGTAGKSPSESNGAERWAVAK